MKKIFLTSLILVFIFSDFYYDFGRLFDYLYIVILLFFLIETKKINSKFYIGISLIFFLLSPWIIYGFFNGNSLISIAVITGLFVVFPLSFSTFHFFKSEIIKSILEKTIIILISTMLIQIFSYYIFDYYLDFSSYFGSIKSRGDNNLLLFRPHGITQEPNAFSVLMLCLVYLYSKFKVVNIKLVLISLVTVVFSLSLWGVIMAPLFYLITLRKNISIRSNILLFFGAMILINYFINSDLASSQEIISRLDFSQQDSSRDARYGGLTNFIQSSDFIFGEGINSNLFQIYGANGIAFFLNSFGLIGCLLIIIIIIIQKELKNMDIIFLIFIFSSYPIISYMYFWVTLALLIYLNKIKCVEFLEE